MSLVTTLPAIRGQGATMTSWDNTMASTVIMRTMTTSSQTKNDVMNTTRDYVISEEVKERIVAISIIMACTLVGNLTLILILLCKRSRRIKRVNIFLINLAFGDLAVAMFVNSTEILFLAFGDWVLGSLLCKGMVYVQMVCLASATNLLTAMTLDRYQVIVKPMETLAKRPRILLKITIAWVLSLIFPLPQLFIFVQYEEGLKSDGTPMRNCGSKGYTAPWQRKVYFTFTTTYILIVPMLIMLYCYARIIHVVWVRASKDVLQHSTSAQQINNHHHHHNHNNHHNQHKQQQQQQHNSITSGKKSMTLALKTTKRNHGGDRTKNSKPDDVCETTVDNKDCTNLNSTSPSSMDHHNSVKWAQNVRETTVGLTTKTTTTTTTADNDSNKLNPPKNNNSSTTTTTTTLSPAATKKGSTTSVSLTTASSVQISVRRKMMTSSKRRVLTMTLSVVMSFFICHTPYFVLSLIRIYSDYKIKMETGKVIGEFMVMVHSTLNPLLYGLFTLRQKHLKFLISLVSCYGRGRRPRSGSSDDYDDNKAGEMHCLLRRKHVPKATAMKNKKINSKNGGGGSAGGDSGVGGAAGCGGGGKSGRSNNTSASNESSVISRNNASSNSNNNNHSNNNNNDNNIRAGSPSSMSTSASSSPTSLKSSILSRFRRRQSHNKPTTTTTASNQALPCAGNSINNVRGDGEREDDSTADSLLYSNSDALDIMCTMPTNNIDDHHLDKTSSVATGPLHSSSSMTNLNELRSNSPSPSSSLTLNAHHSNSSRGGNCKNKNSNSKNRFNSLSSSSSSSNAAAAASSSTAAQLPPLPPPPSTSTSSHSTLSANYDDNKSSLSSSSIAARKRRSFVGSGKSLDKNNDSSDENNSHSQHHHHHHHHHSHRRRHHNNHHHGILRNRRQQTFESDSDDSSTVLANPLASLDAAKGDEDDVIEQDVNTTRLKNNDNDVRDDNSSVCDVEKKEEKEEDVKEGDEVLDEEKMVMIEKEKEKREEEEEEEEEEVEIIHPVDFNSVPWEDEFIIGNLSRV